MLDLIAVLLVLFLAVRGKSRGLVKTVLGMLSVVVCAGLTVAVFNYISDAGVISALEDTFVLKIDPQLGVFAGYIAAIIVALAIFVIVKLLYKLVVDMISFVVPRFIDSGLGFLFGALQAVLLILVLLGASYFVSGNIPAVKEHIDSTVVLKNLYYNNPLFWLFK